MSAFEFIKDTRKVQDGTEHLTRVLWKGECIANIVERFVPSEKGTAKGKVPIEYQHMTPEEYVQTFGYMAEFRRQWNLGNKISWSEDLRVRLS